MHMEKLKLRFRLETVTHGIPKAIKIFILPTTTVSSGRT